MLVTGGADAVSIHAIQFARGAGARVFTTVSRDEQAIVAKDAGADLVVNRHEDDPVTRMQETRELQELRSWIESSMLPLARTSHRR